MASIFLDTFETGDLSLWTSVTGSPAAVSSAGLDMQGSWCFLASSGENVQKTIAGASEYWFSLYVRPTSAGTYILTLYHGSNRIGRVRLESAHLTAYVGTSKVATGTAVLGTSSTYFLRVRYKVDNTVGVIQVYVDDVLDIDFSGDTQPSSDTTIDSVVLDSSTYIDNILVDDAGFFLVDADPIVLSVTPPLGDWPDNITIAAEPIVVTFIQRRSVYSNWPAAPRNPDLDITFDCALRDNFGELQGILVFTAGITGTWLNITIFPDPITCTVSQLGTFVEGVLVTLDPIVVTVGLADVMIVTEVARKNWVQWSDIGHLDFTIDKTNVAGERPMDWTGWVYAIKKLGDKVIVYGENGVSALIPSGNAYGLRTLYRIGLKGKGAVAGDDDIHYFIDNIGYLWEFTSEGLKKLDYSEYLAGMLDGMVLSWDTENKFLYICDGSQGYVYSQDTGSLGAGPGNVTGIGSQYGTLYVAAPAAVETPALEICTDIMDLGSRRGKNIQSVEVGTDWSGVLSVAIDYRLDQSADFEQTDWHVVDRRGLVYIPCYGKEFRIRLKTDSYEYMELDYLTVSGEVCGN